MATANACVAAAELIRRRDDLDEVTTTPGKTFFKDPSAAFLKLVRGEDRTSLKRFAKIEIQQVLTSNRKTYLNSVLEYETIIRNSNEGRSASLMSRFSSQIFVLQQRKKFLINKQSKKFIRISRSMHYKNRIGSEYKTMKNDKSFSYNLINFSSGNPRETRSVDRKSNSTHREFEHFVKLFDSTENRIANDVSAVNLYRRVRSFAAFSDRTDKKKLCSIRKKHFDFLLFYLNCRRFANPG